MDYSKLGKAASYMPIFEFMFSDENKKFFNINRVLEFGMGHGSTTYLLDKKVDLYSVETSKEWLEKCYQATNPLHSAFLYTEENMGDILNEVLADMTFDMIFVDGAVNSRVSSTNNAFGRSPIIIQHDTEDKYYHWEKINVPSDYKEITYTFHQVWTTVITNNADYYERFLSFNA